MQAAMFRENHPRLFIAALIALVCIGQTFFLGLPVYIQMTGSGWGFSASQLGLVTAAEIAGGTAGSLLVSFVLANHPVRRVLAFSVLALIVGNGFLTTQQSFEATMAARAISGLGCGIINSTTLKYVASSGTYLSAQTIAQGIYTLVLQLLLPTLPSAEIAYGLVAALACVGLPAMLLFARGESMVDEFAATKSAVNRRGAYLALGSLLALYAACGVIWTFIEHVGAAAGLDEHSMSAILGFGPVLSLGICWVVPRLIESGHRFGTTVVLLLTCALSAVVLMLPLTIWSFAIGSFIFFTSWNGAIVLIFATVAAYDPIGRHVALANGFLGIGYAAGSTLAGVMIERTTGQTAFAMAAVFGIASAGLYALLRNLPDAEVLDDTAHGSAEELIATPETLFRP